MEAKGIWDTIATDPEPCLTPVQRLEIERRVADDDANPDDGIPWEQVKANALARMKP